MLYAGYLASSLFILLLQHKFLAYHFATLILLLSPLAAIGWSHLFTAIAPNQARWSSAALIVVLMAFYLPWIPLLRLATDLAQARPHPVERFQTAFEYNHSIGVTPTNRTLSYLHQHSLPSDTIEVLGIDSRLRARLAAPSATRFTAIPQLGMLQDWSRPNTEANHTPYQRAWRHELVRVLARSRPTYIVLVRSGDVWRMHDGYTDILHTIPGFDSILAGRYSYDTAFGAYQVFRLY
jgi:hypothetical protein